mmetsp:Transcript_20876/g.31612  ORF Transcript_20876/g.31612 Transcript_20876/m.31612 type:complete len:384 (-) Transcript_20876:2000-3151(-)
MPMTKRAISALSILILLLIIIIQWSALGISTKIQQPNWIKFLIWSVSNYCWTSPPSWMEQTVWESWEKLHGSSNRTANFIPSQEIPCMSIQDQQNPLEFLEAKYGPNWKDRPLLLKGLWKRNIVNENNRRLSLEGLLHENLTISYFSDARNPDLLSPDERAPIREIVAGMQAGYFHKIGTQNLVNKYPDLLHEVAPLNIVKKLFGDYHFQEDNIIGTGILNKWMLPKTLTVPVFVARSTNTNNITSRQCDVDSNRCQLHAITSLHCEPISNLAVQLAGVREWTLINPEYSTQLRPFLGDRAYFFSNWHESYHHIPRYHVQTRKGDALWLPAWTWHKVDYHHTSSTENDISIAASLFHFRPIDFIRRNPLYAFLVLPKFIQEAV